MAERAVLGVGARRDVQDESGEEAACFLVPEGLISRPALARPGHHEHLGEESCVIQSLLLRDIEQAQRIELRLGPYHPERVARVYLLPKLLAAPRRHGDI